MKEFMQFTETINRPERSFWEISEKLIILKIYFSQLTVK